MDFVENIGEHGGAICGNDNITLTILFSNLSSKSFVIELFKYLLH